MHKITKKSPVALVELAPTEYGRLYGKPSYDEYSMVTKRIPPRALPTLEGVLLAQGYQNINTAPSDSDVVCISAITRTAKQSLELARTIKQNNQEAKIIFGGSHFTVKYEEALNNRGDVVVFKEGEILPEILDTGFDYEKLSQIKGIAFRKENEIILTEPRLFLTSEQLSSVHPHYDNTIRRLSNIAIIETMRGCPWNCEQCGVTEMYGGHYRARSIEWTIEELKRIDDIGRTIFYISDNIAGNPKHLSLLSFAIEEAGLNKKFGVCQITSKALRNPEVVKSLKRIGIKMACVGYESMNPEFLKDMEKPCSVEDNQEAARILREAGIWNHGMIMTGGKDTRDSLEYELQWAIKNLDSAQFFPMGNIPGTRFDERMRGEGRMLCEDYPRDYPKMDGHHVLVRPENMSPYELQIITDSMYSRFYSPSNNIRRIFKSPDKAFAIALGIYTNLAGGLTKVSKSREHLEHLEFLKSVS